MRGEFLDLGDCRVYYYASGTRGAGDPILLIHGFPASSHVWFDVVAKLPAGHRVIVCDLLGFGRSDMPADMELSVSSHGRRIVELLDALRVDRACLVGHGVGGAVATWVALHARDRVSRLGVIQSATTTGWFSRHHPLGRALRSALLRGPVWCWMPLAQLAIARTYDDWSQGYRSAAMYLLPFTTPAGLTVLRRHLEDLTNGDIAALGATPLDPALPYLAVTSKDSNFSPEEHPSEIAASVARLLQS